MNTETSNNGIDVDPRIIEAVGKTAILIEDNQPVPNNQKVELSQELEGKYASAFGSFLNQRILLQKKIDGEEITPQESLQIDSELIKQFKERIKALKS